MKVQMSFCSCSKASFFSVVITCFLFKVSIFSGRNCWSALVLHIQI